MLILSRKKDESIIINGNIEVKIVRVDGDVVKVGIEAPRDVPIHREEIYQQIKRSNEGALNRGQRVAPSLKPKDNAATSESSNPKAETVSA